MKICECRQERRASYIQLGLECFVTSPVLWNKRLQQLQEPRASPALCWHWQTLSFVISTTVSSLLFLHSDKFFMLMREVNYRQCLNALFICVKAVCTREGSVGGEGAGWRQQCSSITTESFQINVLGRELTKHPMVQWFDEWVTTRWCICTSAGLCVWRAIRHELLKAAESLCVSSRWVSGAEEAHKVRS